MSIKKCLGCLCCLLALALLFSGCRRGGSAVEESPSPDPHEGMVFVEDEDGGRWIPLYENLPVAAFDGELFSFDGAYINYNDKNIETLRGIDVSSHQKEIDWAAVRAEGIDFAMIRAIYRGYTEGGLFEDELCRANIEGALENGIRVGLYGFSQAITPEEAVEEAEQLLAIAGEYEITMPIVFDWEHIGTEAARTDELSPEQITDCCIAFCDTVAAAGYRPMVYFYKSLGYEVYDLGRLAGYDFWLADPGDKPGFYYDFAMWQYAYDASIPGIETDVDLNLCFRPYEESPEAGSPEPSGTPGA